MAKKALQILAQGACLCPDRYLSNVLRTAFDETQTIYPLYKHMTRLILNSCEVYKLHIQIPIKYFRDKAQLVLRHERCHGRMS